MKKSLLAVLLLLCVSFHGKSQDWMDTQHEVSLSYGALPVLDMLSYYENYFTPENENILYDDKGKFGSLNFSYLFYPDGNWGLGLFYSYTNSDKRILNLSNSAMIGSVSNTFHTIAPSFKYNWFNYDFITLYSRVNIGVSIATMDVSLNDLTEKEPAKDTEIKPFFMYQVSPIGIEVGRQVAGFVEVGFGHMGTVMAGLRYRM